MGDGWLQRIEYGGSVTVKCQREKLELISSRGTNPLFYVERGSTDHLERVTEKSSPCAMAPDLLEHNVLELERYVAQNKNDVGRKEIT
jgi:hypothetical protein